MSEKIINLEVASDILTKKILDAAFYVHQNLGPGLLESAYEECLSLSLFKHGLNHKRQVPMAIEFDGKIIENAYKLDFLVENSVILEIKACERLLPIHEAQLMTYLRFSKIKKGLLINFSNKYLKDGIRRIVF